MPLYFGRPISAPLPCPAQALTSPSLSLQEVRLIDRGEEQAARATQPCLGMRTAGCSRAKQLPEVIYSLGTRVRGRPGDPG